MKWKNKRFALLGTSALCVLLAGFLALPMIRVMRPVGGRKSEAVRAAGYGFEKGDVDHTIQVMKEIYEAAKANGGSLKGVHLDMRRLSVPDRIYAESPAFRDPQTVSFYLPSRSGSPTYEGQVLAFTEIYYYRDFRPDGANDHTTASPKGFYLVLYADGQVKRIAPDELRVLGSQVAFPGMKQYRLDLPKPLELQNAGASTGNRA